MLSLLTINLDICKWSSLLIITTQYYFWQYQRTCSNGLFALTWCNINVKSRLMTKAWNKEQIWVPDRNQTQDLLNARQALYPSGFKTSRQPPEFRRLLDCMSPATLLITVCSWQTISVLFLSLRQHSNFTLNFAAIIHTQKDVSVV